VPVLIIALVMALVCRGAGGWPAGSAPPGAFPALAWLVRDAD